MCATVYTVGAIWWKATKVTAGLAESNGSLPQYRCMDGLKLAYLYSRISSGPNAR